jgi:hypothetical protein
VIFGQGEFGVVPFPPPSYVQEYKCIYKSIWNCIWIGIEQNGITRGISKLEWHISKFDFYNGISPNGESYNGINPINPRFYEVLSVLVRE